jgi:ketosteroid isomerase-like protein
MAQDTVELVREIYARFRAGDEQAGMMLLDPEIELHDRPELVDPQVYRGHEGVIRALDVSRAEFEDADIVPEEFIPVGESKVVVVFHFVGHGRESGFPIDERLCHVWTLRHGRGARVEVHTDRAEALRAAGA